MFIESKTIQMIIVLNITAWNTSEGYSTSILLNKEKLLLAAIITVSRGR